MSRCKSHIWRKIRTERRARRRFNRLVALLYPRWWKTMRQIEICHGPAKLRGEVGRIEFIRWTS